MYNDQSVEIWNLTEGGTLNVAPQEVVPIVGHIHDWDPSQSVQYRLNGGDPFPVALTNGFGSGRLYGSGNFGIDSIVRDDFIDGPNCLEIEVGRSDGTVCSKVTFDVVRPRSERTEFRLDLEGAGPAESIGQVIDGRWRVVHDQDGAHLAVVVGDEGYDRIVLFGDESWTTGYEIVAEFTIDRYLPQMNFHCFGPVFKWRPHVQGGGAELPRTWTSGLGIFSSAATGLAVRYGVEARKTPDGERLGERIVGCSRVSHARFLRNRLTGAAPIIPQIQEFPTGHRLRMRLVIDHGRHHLSIGPVGWSGWHRQASIDVDSHEDLPSGAVGFLAAYCAVRLHEYRVTPL